ncbi:MAG: hypothetical protein H6999_10890 [Hahellaceae bacterium]|nr:hypothetical protein [Hahellaceae bacterium]
MWIRLKQFWDKNMGLLIVFLVIGLFFCEAIYPGFFQMTFCYSVFILFIGMPALLFLCWLLGI